MSEQLRLFAKTGTLGAEPDDFYARLAGRYNAFLYNTDAVRVELGKGKLIFNQRMTDAVRLETEKRAAISLERGVSVVYDGFLNTATRREQVCALAKPAGAKALVLCIDAPWELIEDRLIERYEANKLPIPSHLIESLDRYIDVIYDMDQHLKWPGPEENLDVIDLDGTQTTDQLLAQVARVAPLPKL